MYMYIYIYIYNVCIHVQKCTRRRPGGALRGRRRLRQGAGLRKEMIIGIIFIIYRKL